MVTVRHGLGHEPQGHRSATDAPGSQELTWDAGDMGCGELLVKLKLRLRDEVAVGGLIRLTSTDPGAREDIPSWSRLTGNPLIHADHPHYVIQRNMEAR